MRNKKTVLAVILAAVMMAGCAGSGGTSTFRADKNNIFVSQTGTLSSATVETYENQDYYSEEEWKSELDLTLTAYNSEHGEGAVEMRSCGMKDGKASLAFDYRSAADLVEFTKTYEDTANQVDSMQVITVAEARAQGLMDGAVFVKASDGKKVTEEELLKKEDAHIVITEGANSVVIQTEGKILFASEGTFLQDSYTAATTAGKTFLIFK